MVKLSDLEAVQGWVRTCRVMHSLVPASTKLPDPQTDGNKNVEMATPRAQVVLAQDFKEGSKEEISSFHILLAERMSIGYFTVLNYSKEFAYPSKKYLTKGESLNAK